MPKRYGLEEEDIQGSDLTRDGFTYHVHFLSKLLNTVTFY